MANTPFNLINYKMIRPFKISRATKKSMAGHSWPAGLEFDTYVKDVKDFLSSFYIKLINM